MPAPRESCPECGESIPVPGGAHGIPGQNMHSHTDCSRCGTALIWWTEGHFSDQGWMVEDAEMRRRAHADKYDD